MSNTLPNTGLSPMNDMHNTTTVTIKRSSYQRLARQLASMPYTSLLTAGKLLGYLSYYLSPYRRHIANVNLRLCFPEMDKAARQKLIRAHFVSAGQGVMEAFMAWWRPRHLLPQLHINGLEHVARALKAGKGVIFLSAHFTSLEMVGRLLSEKLGFAVIYRKQKNQWINKIMKQARQRIYQRAIDRRDGRGIFRALKDNMPIWLAADQDYGRDHSNFALFFGLPAAFITSPTRLAHKTGAAVIPAMYHRLPGGRGYQVDFKPAIHAFASNDMDTNARLTSECFETAIKSHPEQYLWIHRRFKTRPEGKARYYQ